MSTNAKLDARKTKYKEWGSFFLVILFALAVRLFVMELFFVPTGSMQATILENEYIFSTKYSYGYSNYSPSFFAVNFIKGRVLASPPRRGDIIIFRPPHNIETRYIKRLIGLPGDKVELINDVIYINDNKTERSENGIYISEKGRKYKRYKEKLPNGLEYFSYKKFLATSEFGSEQGSNGTFYVPQNQYFFLGDNRDESNDSRFELGFVPFENFIAKGQFILFSTKEKFWDGDLGLFAQIFRLGPWLMSIRFGRIFNYLYD